MENNDIVLIQLDKERKLRISYKATKLYKAKFGKSFAKIDLDNFDLEDVAKIIYVGLIHEDTELTFEKVEELIDNTLLSYCIQKMKEAIEASFGKNVQGTVEAKAVI